MGLKRGAIRDRVMKADDLRRETVEVPEWGLEGGEALTVRGLTGTARDEFEESCLLRGKPGAPSVFTAHNLRAKLVAKCCIDEDGLRVFSEEDVEWLGGKSAAALSRVYDVAAKLSRIGADEVEDLLKNSARVQSESSSSDLPLLSDAPVQNS
jgi:hypothetical protein